MFSKIGSKEHPFANQSELSLFGKTEDYSRLYTCKHFRNRVIRLQSLCADLNVDAILLIIGQDSRHDEEMRRLLNWLFFGRCSSDIFGASPHKDFEDMFVAISRDGMQLFTHACGFKETMRLTVLVQNLNTYVLTKADENEPDKAEAIKIARFYELLHDKKTVAMPVAPHATKTPNQVVEQWPLIQAYGLDMVGNGFFGMKHKLVPLAAQLRAVYAEFDSFSTFRVVIEEVSRLNQTFHDNFFNLNRHTLDKRLNMTEQDMIDAFWINYEFSLLANQQSKTPIPEDGLPLPRVLIGPERTNVEDMKELSNPKDRLYKLNNFDEKHKNLHFTFEYCDKETSLRVARTYFLTSLVAGEKDYLFDCHFTFDEDKQVKSAQGLANQRHAATLFGVYMALISAHKTACKQLMLKQISVKELVSERGAALLQEALMADGRISKKAFPRGIQEHLKIQVKQYNSFGETSKSGSEDVHKRLLTLVRMQVVDIHSERQQNENLGSVLFADSFFSIEPKTFITVTRNVPNLQFWMTDNLHYMNMPLPILAEKTLYCEQLGDKLTEDVHNNVLGLLPVNPIFGERVPDIILVGKLQFFERGFIFFDNRIGAFVVPFRDIKKVTFHLGELAYNNFMQVEVNDKGKTKLPALLLALNTFFLKVPREFCQAKLSHFVKVFESISNTRRKYLLRKNAPKPAKTDSESEEEEERIEEQFDMNVFYEEEEAPAAEQLSNECSVLESFSYKNFQANNQKYSAFQGCDYVHNSFSEKTNSEIMEFHAIAEFNALKQKTFIPLNQFVDVYRQIQEKPLNVDNALVKMAERLKRKSGQPFSVVLVSGIPCSHKFRFATSLSTQLANEYVSAVPFRMRRSFTKYSTEAFVEELTEFSKSNGSADVFVAVLPSYHHLKKCIFELRKHEEFVSTFEIKFVITKVNARNFYTNKNRNTYQFLIENCMKGVSHAVILERNNMPEGEVAIMIRALQSANFTESVLPVSGRVLDLESLAQILMRQNEKFNMTYTKYFYGFEKEGSSKYFNDKQVTGHYFVYKFPIKEAFLFETLVKAVGLPIADVDFLRPKKQEDVQREALEKEAELAKVNTMTDRERRKYQADQRKKERQEADLAPEKQMRATIDETKRRIDSQQAGGNLLYERLHGFVKVEGSQKVHELMVHFNEMRLSVAEKQDVVLGFTVYGRNVADNDEKVLREVLRTCRSEEFQFLKKKIQTRADLTPEDIAKVQDEYCGSHLPSGWYFTGYNYVDDDGKKQDKHPNLDFLIDLYLEKENYAIGNLNREVTKQLKEDAEKFETQI